MRLASYKASFSQHYRSLRSLVEKSYRSSSSEHSLNLSERDGVTHCLIGNGVMILQYIMGSFVRRTSLFGRYRSLTDPSSRSTGEIPLSPFSPSRSLPSTLPSLSISRKDSKKWNRLLGISLVDLPDWGFFLRFRPRHGRTPAILRKIDAAEELLRLAHLQLTPMARATRQ